MDAQTIGGSVVLAVFAVGFLQIWRRSGKILDELRIQRAERLKGAPLTDEEIEHIETSTDALAYQPPVKKA